MKDINILHAPRTQNFFEILKSWSMIAMISAFALFYVGSFFGRLEPFADLFRHFEPIIFVIVGYALARFPMLQIEETLNAEILRQAQKAEAAQHAKERSQQQLEILEEKLRNVTTALRADSVDILRSILPENGGHSQIIAKSVSNRSSIGTALKILDS